jgi:alcohol dehydrogenase class IV
MRTIWSFHCAGQILFGRGAVRRLGEVLSELRAQRVLLLSDAALQSAGIVDLVQQQIRAAASADEAFVEGEPEPSIDLAQRAVEQARRFRPDVLIGLGGGSNMDLAKIVATCLAHGGTPRDYVGESRIAGPVTPLVCIPTTAGTGSEVSAASVLTDTQSAMKVGILSNYLRPRVALVDPELTLSCPPKVTADSGIDALTHAIEAYTAVDNEAFPLPEGERSVYQGRHPLGDCLAEKAIALVGQHLATAVREPHNLAAREGMALAAMLAGLAFSNVGVALVHAMEYPLGGATHCSHGAGNGLLLPYVMRFNQPARVPQFARIATLLGVDTTGMQPTEAAEAAIAAVERLRAEIGIPTRLRQLGVVQEQLPGFAEKAFAVKRILRVNPRAVTQQAIEAIYREAL